MNKKLVQYAYHSKQFATCIHLGDDRSLLLKRVIYYRQCEK